MFLLRNKKNNFLLLIFQMTLYAIIGAFTHIACLMAAGISGIWGMVECLQQYEYIGLDKQKFQSKIVNISLPILFSICFGCSKNHLIETVL